VWQQLRQLCDQSPLCAPARLQEVNRKLQELCAEVAALRQRNAHLEQQVAQLQGLQQQQ
jgi:cell division protein FtsB